MPVNLIDDAILQPLGAGARAAITLALSMHDDLILIDERKGISVAIAKGFVATGTLGILRAAAQRGLTISPIPSASSSAPVSAISKKFSMTCQRIPRGDSHVEFG
jgi:predicted nucleic acid-binding protein